MPLDPSPSHFRLLHARVRPGRVTWLGVRPERRAPMLVVQSVHLDPERGLVADRYGRAAGARQVTLVEAEHPATIASHMGLSQVQPEDLRRNIVTAGINLLALKERRFKIGSAILETTGECHPCSRLEENRGVGGFNVVQGLGGITARIIGGGVVTIGDIVEPLLSDLTI